jgi:hypothetical protein
MPVRAIPLLREREKGSRIRSPSPVLGERLRVSANALTRVARLIKETLTGLTDRGGWICSSIIYQGVGVLYEVTVYFLDFCR